MSEERRAVHPEEPAKGAQEDVEAPGVEHAGDPSNPATAAAGSEEERSARARTSRPRGERTRLTRREPAVRTTPPERRPSVILTEDIGRDQEPRKGSAAHGEDGSGKGVPWTLR
jgi:hypothetical protein